MAEIITAVMARGGLDPVAIESACSSGRCGVLLAGGKRSSGVGRAVLIPLEMDVASPSGLILTIQVRFGYRGLGIGGRLIEAAAERARKIGWTALFARVAAENVRSLGLFRSRGFFEAAPWERPAGMAPEDHWLVKRFSK